ncbi:beta-propeller domain-containing protein [Nocardioides dilutus]
MAVTPLPPRLRRSVTVLGVAAGLVGAFAAGTAIAGDDPVRDRVDPIAFSGDSITLAASCDDLLDWYVARGVQRVGPWGWDTYYPEEDDDGIFGLPGFGGGEDAADSGRDTGAAVEPQAAQEYAAPVPATVRSENGDSGTNVQELGVDEPDVVKTDGRTLFRVEDDDLVTYDVTGEEVERIGSMDLEDLDDGELLLSGDTAVVVGTDGGGRGTYYPEARQTRVIVLDVSDPSDPEVEHTYLFSSATLEARLHGDTVRLVTQAGMPDLDFETDDDPEDALRENRDIVRDSEIGDWLPTITTDDGDPEPLVDCEDVAIPNDGDSLGTIVVVGFEADEPEDRSVSGLAVATQLAYLSSDQLYLATSGGVNDVGRCFDVCFEEPVAPDRRPGGGSDGVTHLYAFDLDGTETRYAASGEVDGWVRDRWAMDEAGGVLRLAVGPSQRTGNDNSVVTFRRDGNDLVEAGRVDGLGVGEDIKSVRWFDGLAIVVTFRQVDPLYAVDLTDPDDPDLLGELKIPGFSAYLHPLGAHRLLGLGEGPGDRGGWGAQAGLFNVTDLTDPRQLDVLSYGAGTRALVADDPRQLTWLPERRQVLTVIESWKRGGQVGLVSVLSLGSGQLDNRMVEVEQGSDVTQVRLVPLPDGRVVLATARDAEFFDL